MLAVRARALFDGVGPGLVEQPTVLIENGRIAAVRPGGIPLVGTEILDLGTATLLPGFIDTHTHLAFDASDDVIGRLTAADDATLLERIRAAARASLAAGVTTVRDLGDRGYLTLRLRAETARNPAAGPHIVASGPPLTTTRGHCWFLGGQAEGVAGVRAAVRERAERGADVVKVMVTGGDLTPGSDPYSVQYGRDELRAVVDEAHRHGLPTAAHAHAVTGIREAVAAGFDTVEHCFFLTESGVDFDRRVIEEMVRRAIPASLTLGALPGGPPPPAHIARRIPSLIAGLTTLREAGVTMALGSDSGIFPVKAHGSYPYGITAMTDFGFTPAQALRAATSTAAMVCGVGGRKGRIAAGYDADLIAVGGDPLADVGVVREVVAVVRDGTRVG
ncbi:amidohydrolase family protein [Streptomyces albofaciens JCM 4342]|uniref:metal-dependent hydrolase family protein n=1 Tax=Streptomyces albofaciens TaxID=66866 RepID=UPI00123AA458|nr:amidohydrolase family protein [Streptomyces albofaciens]KAA6222972.1 amidohydrolase family protein [Streptomyces albofaciens JCM 4342]